MPRLSDYLEEVELNTPLEALKEVPVGRFKISAATIMHDDTNSAKKRSWVQTRCKLFVVVEPKNEKALKAAHKRHRGMFEDMILKILRSASMDELSDPHWATIKMRISDSAKSLLGRDRIRQVVIDDYGWEPI